LAHDSEADSEDEAEEENRSLLKKSNKSMNKTVTIDQTSPVSYNDQSNITGKLAIPKDVDDELSKKRRASLLMTRKKETSEGKTRQMTIVVVSYSQF
jgi:hypothetical protein